MNPILARIRSVVADGRHPMSVRVSAAGRGRWTLTLTLDDTTSPEEAADARFPPVKQGSLPAGVSSNRSWVRFPDDVSEIQGSSEAVETWIAEAARVGKAIDWARFDAADGGSVDGYPVYLTKPEKWLKSTNPQRQYLDFPTRLRSLREAAGLSVQELAEAASLTRQAVYALESGQNSPSWATVQALASALKVSTETLRDRE